MKPTPKIGDTVYFNFNSVIESSSLEDNIDIIVSEALTKELGIKKHVGKVVKISTHTWLGLIKRTRPLYFVRLDLYPDVVLKTDVVHLFTL